MNIFATSPDARTCAQALDDRRVNKLILESAQMLCGALRYHDAPYACLPRTQESGGTKPLELSLSQFNNPCTQWTRASRKNFVWLADHMRFLCYEHTRVAGHVHWHEQYIEAIFEGSNWLPFGKGRMAFVNCTDNHKTLPLFEAYKLHLRGKWAEELRSHAANPKLYKPSWKNRVPPEWVHSTLWELEQAVA